MSGSGSNSRRTSGQAPASGSDTVSRRSSGQLPPGGGGSGTVSRSSSGQLPPGGGGSGNVSRSNSSSQLPPGSDGGPSPGPSLVPFPVLKQCIYCASFEPGPPYGRRMGPLDDTVFSRVIYDAAIIALAGRDFQRRVVAPVNLEVPAARQLKDTTQMSDHLERVFHLRLRLGEDLVRNGAGRLLEARTDEHLRQKTASIRPTPSQLTELITVASEQNESIRKATGRVYIYRPQYADIASVVPGPSPTQIGVLTSYEELQRTTMDTQGYLSHGAYYCTGALFALGLELVVPGLHHLCTYCI